MIPNQHPSRNSEDIIHLKDFFLKCPFVTIMLVFLTILTIGGVLKMSFIIFIILAIVQGFNLSIIYGAEIGIPREFIFLTFLVVQFVGIPFTFAYGWLAGRIGVKSGLMLALAVYFGVCIYASFIDSPTQFLILGMIVATSQGGAQALSRSIFASIVPKTKSSEFFGFFSVSAKFAGIFGPLIFAIVGTAMGSSRPGILSLIVFVVVGMLLLSRVDVEEGRRAAEEEDAEMLVVGS